MKKSTKKYLLYGAGAYVLLTSGVLGASKVQSYKKDMEENQQDYEARDESRIREIQLLEQSLDASTAEIRALQGKLAEAQRQNESNLRIFEKIYAAFTRAEEFIVKKDLSLNMWNQYLNNYGGNIVRSDPLARNYANVTGTGWNDPPELPPHSPTASN